MAETSTRTRWEKARDRLGRDLGYALDWAFVAEVKAERYNPRAFDALQDRFLAMTDDPWERLAVLQCVAMRRLGLACDYDRPLREIKRLFEAERRLGYSSSQAEETSVCTFAKALADRGKLEEADAMLVTLEDKLAEQHHMLGHNRRYLAQFKRLLKRQRCKQTD